MSYEDIAEIKEFIETKKLDKSPQTVRSYITAINKFLDYFKTDNINDISLQTCRDYQKFLSSSGIKKSSINTYIRPLKILFNFLIEDKRDNPFNKIKDLKTPKPVPDYLSDEEIDKMLNSCDRILDKAIIATIILLGLRREELTNIKLSDVHDTFIHIEGKGDKDSDTPLREDLKSLLDSYLEERNKHNYSSKYFFVSKMGDKFSGESIFQIFKKAAKNAGLSDERISQIHPHLGRHSYAIRLRKSCKDIRIVQRGLRHQNVNTTIKFYDRVFDDELAKAMFTQTSILG